MYIALIITIALTLWYFSIDTQYLKSAGWDFKKRVVGDPERHPWRIAYLIGWPLLGYLSFTDKFYFTITPVFNVLFALLLAAWVIVEAYKRVSTFGESLPLFALGLVSVAAIGIVVNHNQAVIDAMKMANDAVTLETTAPPLKVFLLMALPFMVAIAIVALLIANLVWRSETKNAKRIGWGILLVALLLIIGVILYQYNDYKHTEAFVKEEQEKIKKGTGTDSDPSLSSTETLTTSDETNKQNNEKAKLPDPVLVRDIFSDEESVKDLAAKWWSDFQYKYKEDDGSEKVGYRMCMHSMPICRDDRLMDDGLSVPFSTEESWRKEMLDEHLNPFWFYADASRLILIPEIDEAYPFLREYVKLYEEKGPQYFVKGELVTDEYLKYAVAGGLFVNSSPITLEKNVKTETVWRLENGNSLDATKLKVVRRDGYEEKKPWNDVLILRHYSDKTGNSYLEIFDYYDRAPVILKEEDPKPTPSPTDKPKPSPTDKPKPTDKPSPTPDPTPSPTPEPSPTPTEEPKDPTQGTSSTNTEENDNKGTGENTNPAQPTSTPESTKEQENNSTKSDQKDYEKKIADDAPEPTTKVEAQKSTVPDCDNPGETKEVEGTVFGDEKEAEKPTEEEQKVNVGDDDKPVVNEENNPAGSWRGGGRK